MNSLTDLCYQQIQDNYYYAKYMDIEIIVDKSTGYFNATKLCQLGNKSYKNWYSLETTQELFKYIEQNKVQDQDMSYKVSDEDSNSKISGTYIHQYLIVNLAMWISPDFYLKCCQIKLDISEREYRKKTLKKDDTIDKFEKTIQKIQQLEISNESRHQELRNDIFEVKTMLSEINNKILKI